MYYTLHTARQKDRVGILRVLTVLASCKNDRAYEDPFLHSLVCAQTLIHILGFKFFLAKVKTLNLREYSVRGHFKNVSAVSDFCHLPCSILYLIHNTHCYEFFHFFRLLF